MCRFNAALPHVPRIRQSRAMLIRRLSDDMINRIAAGEVIERPASVVKELTENAIDAGARRIDVAVSAGGVALIRVTDDGSGMRRADLELAIERHSTSKLSDDLLDIRTLGFRGEALASIGAVARLSIASRHESEPHGWEIVVEGGVVRPARPAAIARGTRVEVADLFFATPARLKFLKGERAEASAAADIVRRLAMAHPEIRFQLSTGERGGSDFSAPDRSARIGELLGAEFSANAMAIEAEREGVRLSGEAGLPTFHRANSLQQFLFVNGRPVRDKLLLGALRAGYADVMSRDRFPVAALFLELDPHEVDVNVHPAKSDVRFRDPGLVRGLIVGALRRAIHEAGHRASTTGGGATITALRPIQAPSPGWRPGFSPMAASGRSQAAAYAGFAEPQRSFEGVALPSADARADIAPPPDRVQHPLGAARAQLHENYIVAQTADGLVIVDQHAAHERLVYERLKGALARSGVATQLLLIPQVVDMAPENVARILARADELAELGLVVEGFGPGAIAVRETPALLGEIDAAGLLADLADDLAEWDETTRLRERLDHVAATLACHGSVRSGRRLKAEEMDALLREMEVTPGSGQCNHGRPTYVELKLSDIERLFGRR